jgi:hypothetical protein
MPSLRKLFGPSKEEVWRRLSAEIGADYSAGGWMKRGKVQVEHGQWTITLDTFTVSTGKTVMVFTRLRAPYINPDGFRFTIYRRGILSDIGKFFGMQDVRIGHYEFDRDFIIKGTDEGRLRSLFGNTRIRELIAAQSQIHLTVKDHEGHFGPEFPPDTDELYFVAGGIIKDTARLKALFELFAETLDQLCHIGSAYENKPAVKL